MRRVVAKIQHTRIVRALKKVKRPFAPWRIIAKFASPFRSSIRHSAKRSATGPKLARKVPAWSLLVLLLLGVFAGFASAALMGQLGSGHGPSRPDFAIGTTPGSLSSPQGQIATVTVSMTSLNGFAGSVNLNVTASPNMLNATFDMNPDSVSLLSGSASSTLTIAIPATEPVKAYFLTLVGTSGDLSRSVKIILQVTVPPPPDFQLQSAQSSITVTARSSASTTITLTSLGGFSGIVDISSTISPNSASSPTLSLNPVRVTLLSGGTASVVLTITTSGTTSTGSYSIVVQGVSGSLSNTTTINLTVQ